MYILLLFEIKYPIQPCFLFFTIQSQTVITTTQLTLYIQNSILIDGYKWISYENIKKCSSNRMNQALHVAAHAIFLYPLSRLMLSFLFFTIQSQIVITTTQLTLSCPLTRCRPFRNSYETKINSSAYNIQFIGFVSDEQRDLRSMNVASARVPQSKYMFFFVLKISEQFFQEQRGQLFRGVP